MAKADWDRDRRGQEVLGRELFCEAWFQLCDLWTEEICEAE